MAKFFGPVGYVETDVEIRPGVWGDRVVERNHYGDVLRNTRRWESGENVNDNLVINNQISIVADDYANENLFAMKYIRWMGAVWKITNVEIQRPRLLLTIGGVYNGTTASAP